MNDLLEYEKELYDKNIKLIAGIDEVGRGPLCGPVVACACILPENYHLEGLNDSKKLSEKKRDKLYEILINDAISYGLGIISPKRIDEINILEATKEAMKEAIKNLKVKPEHLLIDAVKLETNIPSTSIIKGDAKSASIAAASIIAKVTRDRMMIELGKKYPEYGFEKHKGYGTSSHIDAVKKYGVLDFYRFTFAPISDLIKSSEVEKGSNND